MTSADIPSDVTVNRVCRRHRFGPVELRLGPDDTVAVGPSGTSVRVASARTLLREDDRLTRHGIEVEVDGLPAARLVQPTTSLRRRGRRVFVEPIADSPLRPATFFRLRWWNRVALETDDRGLIARRFWPVNPHRPHTADDVDETTFLLFVAGSAAIHHDLRFGVGRRTTAPPAA